MGEAVTEAGAISAAASFFRLQLDACAWLENITTTPTITSATTGPTALRLLTYPLSASREAGGCFIDQAVTAPIFSDRRADDRLAVSRGPGPDFSEIETRVVAQAATLLGQALNRIAARNALTQTEIALEKSLRGMQEASEAVAVLVGEREQRAELEAERRAELNGEHERALTAAGEEFVTLREKTEEFRWRLDETDKSVAVLANAASAICRIMFAATTTAAKQDKRAGGDGVAARPRGVEKTRDQLFVVVEDAARKGLQCSFARVARPTGVAASASSSQEEEPAGLGPARQVNSAFRHLYTYEKETTSDAAVLNGENTSVNVELGVPVQHCNINGERFSLSLGGKSSSQKSFSATDIFFASALTACLGTALFALHEKQCFKELVEQAENDRKARQERDDATAASNAAAARDAKERKGRTIAGVRALIFATRASETQAEVQAANARRAERHSDAFRHLLAGLEVAVVATGRNRAVLAKSVTERAAGVVPACVSAAFLSPRVNSNNRSVVFKRATSLPIEKCDGNVMFSPDPRVWAAAQGDRRDDKKGRRWAETIQKAASQAAVTGKTVFVMRENSSSTAHVNVHAAVTSDHIFCFSPVSDAFSTAMLDERRSAGLESTKENLRRPSLNTDRMADESTTANNTRQYGLRNVQNGIPFNSNVYVIAWFLCLEGEDLGTFESRDDGQLKIVASAKPTSLVDSTATKTRTPSYPLPPRVSSAIEGVVHAVGLALSARNVNSTGDYFGIDSARQSEGTPSSGIVATGSSSFSGKLSFRKEKRENIMQTASRQSDKRSRADKKLRDEDLGKLREGTSALAERVKMLERKAAELRASEARSSVALVKAKADAMTLKGELELAALERDRLCRRLGDKQEAELVGKIVRRPLVAWSSIGGNRHDEALLFSSSEPQGVVGGQKIPRLSSTGPMHGEYYGKEAWERARGRVSAAAAGRGSLGGMAIEAEKRSSSMDSSAYVEENVSDNEEGITNTSPSKVGIPLPVEHFAASGSSSEALQRMASVHARLSDSLRRGIFSNVPPESRQQSIVERKLQPYQSRGRDFVE